MDNTDIGNVSDAGDLERSICENFEKIYSDFRLKIYKRIFKVLGEREGSLTATEFFAVETIGLMGSPTIGEFAKALSITSSHAAYKVRSLADKGYIVKRATGDRRAFRLEVTDKFTRFYHKEDSYGNYIFSLVSGAMTAEELKTVGGLFEKFVNIITAEK